MSHRCSLRGPRHVVIEQGRFNAVREVEGALRRAEGPQRARRCSSRGATQCCSGAAAGAHGRVDEARDSQDGPGATLALSLPGRYHLQRL